MFRTSRHGTSHTSLTICHSIYQTPWRDLDAGNSSHHDSNMLCYVS